MAKAKGQVKGFDPDFNDRDEVVFNLKLELTADDGLEQALSLFRSWAESNGEVEVSIEPVQSEMFGDNGAEDLQKEIEGSEPAHGPT